MDIGFYIADLLQNQDEVSLPGLGTFSKERMSGSYDRGSNSFTPPGYLIVFYNGQSDFHKLSEYISIKKHLSLSSAEYFIKKFAANIAEHLQTCGTAEIKPLGTIRQKDESFSFEPSENFHFADKFYGFKPVSEIQHLSTLLTVQESQPVVEESMEESISVQDPDVIPEEQFNVLEATESRKIPLIICLLLSIITTGSLLYFLNPDVKAKIDHLFASPSKVQAIPVADNIRSPKPHQPAVALSSSATPDSIIIADSTIKSLPVKKDEPPVEVEVTTIEIIGASFGKKSEAKRFIREMKAKGLNARILDNMPGPLFKVSLASFPDQKSSEGELLRIRKNINKEAWPVKYKSKKNK